MPNRKYASLLNGATERPCSLCGIVKSFTEFYKSPNHSTGFISRCKTCCVSLHREWVKKNKERMDEYRLQYQEKNKERLASRMREYRARKPEIIRRITREAYLRQREKILKKNTQWRMANKEKCRAKAWRYKARKKYAGGSHTGDDVKKLLGLQKRLCVFCKAPLASGYHIDHVVPLSRGGSNNKENIQLLCPACNMRKKARSQEQFARENGLLI